MGTTGKKGRKVGRNAAKCKAYRASFRREHNKMKKLKTRIENHPNDLCAQEAMKVLKARLYSAKGGSVINFLTVHGAP